MIGIFIGDRRIGTVARFEGEPKSRRWVAWSIHRETPSEERKQQFPTKREAIAWLEQIDKENAA